MVRYTANFVEVSEALQNHAQALTGPNASKWKAAMDEEYMALLENRTWDLVLPPANRWIIDCKWHYKVKRNAENRVERLKARLVARGFTQVHGLDYDDIFSPTAKATTLRVLSLKHIHRKAHLEFLLAILNQTWWEACGDERGWDVLVAHATVSHWTLLLRLHQCLVLLGWCINHP